MKIRMRKSKQNTDGTETAEIFTDIFKEISVHQSNQCHLCSYYYHP
jgi:hypothetical protein